MKTLIVSDLITMRSALLQMAGICLVVCAFIAVCAGSLLAAIASVTIMVPFMYLFTVCAYDESGSWELFRLTLPMTRRQVAFGRYASLLLVAAASFVLGFVVAMLVALVGDVAAGSFGAPVPEGLRFHDSLAWEVLGAAVASEVILLVAAAVALPLILRFGMTKGTRMVPMAVVLVMALAIFLMGDGGIGEGLLAGVEAWLSQGNNLALACGGALLVALVLYGASALVAARLYEQREL